MNEIVLIAPYEKMLTDAQHIIARQKYTNVSAVLGDLTDGLIAASKAVDEGAKVLVSRGGTYSLIQYVSPVPVVEIKISALDMADTIRSLQPVKDTIGVVGYRNIMSGSELLEELGKKVIRAELNRKDDVESMITDCGKAGAKVIVGDAVTCRIGRSMGYTCFLMESGEKSLQNAIDEAFRMLEAINREQELVNRYRTLADSVHDAVLATDENNTIVAVNMPACRIFGIPKQEILGLPISDFYAYGSVIKSIELGQPFSEELQQLGSTKIEISNYPITMNGSPHGSIAVFQDITEVQNREKNIRLKLVQKGFIAKYSFSTIIYKSQRMADCIAIAKKISDYDSAVLIEGKSGVGKELFAQSIHNQSRRKLAPFVAVNCAALPPSLIESVLFGYAEGAFTGGSKGGKEGVFELAHTGTLFLDEIGELPIELQGRLLRVVQEHEVMRIGGDSNIPLDVRLICATNRNLKKLAEAGKFRLDLLYRLNTLSLYIPTLNERPEDIQVLADTFLRRYSTRYAKPAAGFTPETVEFLKQYTYEGNVRELQSMIERAVIISEGEQITIHDLCAGLSEQIPDSPAEVSGPDDAALHPRYSADSIGTGKTLKKAEEEYIRQIYEQNGCSASKTCSILGINRSTLWRKLKLQ